MRLFLAIELPDPVRHHLEAVQQLLRTQVASASWTRVQNIHLTLKFLGEVKDCDVPGVISGVNAVKGGSEMGLFAGGLEMLPPGGMVRVIGGSITGDVDKLHTLVEAIEDASADLGFVRENRKYRPHATLARPRSPLPAAMRPELMQTTATLWPGPTFTVTEFVLMQSQLDPRGAIYTPVTRFPLVK